MVSPVVERLFGIEGKIVIVAGATPIGMATANLLREAGASVTLVRTDPNEDDSPTIDLQNEASVAQCFGDILARHGRLDVLVYAATLPGTYPIANMTLAQWDRLQSVNLGGAFLVLREAIRPMIATGGRIIVVSTMGSIHPVLRGNAGYSAAKAGLNAMVRALALDHAADGILVNAVLPGAVPPGAIAADAIADGGPGYDPARLPLGMGSAEDVAAAILYLASPAGRFITGQNLILDGGFLTS